jgi:hypothetical protein
MSVIDKSRKGEVNKLGFKNWWHAGCHGITGCFLDFNLINYDLQKYLEDTIKQKTIWSEHIINKITLTSRGKDQSSKKLK